MDDINVPVVNTNGNKERFTLSHSFSDLKTENHSISLCRMRWFFAIALSIWTLASAVVPVLIFYLIKNPLAFSLFSTFAPPVFLWLQFAKHLFPMDEKTFELKKLKIQAEVQKALILKRVES